MILKFYDWNIKVERDRILFKKGTRGLTISLPNHYTGYSVKRMRIRKSLRDFDTFFGGDEDARPKDVDVLTLRFRLKDRNYLVLAVNYNGHVLVIHGYEDWDGDVYGFYIEGGE